MSKVLLKEAVCKEIDCAECPFIGTKGKVKFKLCMSIKLEEKIGDTVELAKILMTPSQFSKLQYDLEHTLVNQLKGTYDYSPFK